MMAASAAAEKGSDCILLESGNRLGNKIRITGKGRCNITNDCDIESIMDNVRRNRNFLYSSLYTFTNHEIVEYFEKLGVKTKIERGGRVFPVSDKADDVALAMENDIRSRGVRVIKNSKAVDILTDGKSAVGAVDANGTRFSASRVILACGGASYPSTGSDGNGYDLAKKTGHEIVSPRGVLTGLNSTTPWVEKVMGLSLRNVNLGIFESGCEIFSMQGEMLFTHYGISGPIVLTASSALFDSRFSDVTAVLDLKPALDSEKLDRRLQRDFTENSRKDFSNSLDKLLPRKMIPIIVELSGIEATKKVNQITAGERKKLVELLKNLEIKITGSRPINEAIVTAGGVAVEQINPSTMESRIIDNLYFCGEMMDIDANTGGYNLTLAFSTGHLAGSCAAEGL